MLLSRIRCIAVVFACLAGAPAQAQDAPSVMVVLDGSGSMWGQIEGRTKIELAREALSGVLSEAGAEMQIGLMAYGHRRKGQCDDIQTLVPMGAAADTVQEILDQAYALRPKGMTPIVDSVMAAAQEMAFTEQTATVVLLTDGIETCGGDPCALGRMLAAEGIDFTAHVVGFDMTDAEQRQVACLATETGGVFVAADDAQGLGQALRDTILRDTAGPAVVVTPPPPPAPEPQATARMVEFYIRDAVGAAVLQANAFRDIRFAALDEGGAVPAAVALRLGDKPWTLDGAFLPGRYEIQLDRIDSRNNLIRVALIFEVPEGTGSHQVDLVIAARLRLTAMAHAGLPMPAGTGNLPSATYGSASGRAVFRIHPIIGGAIDPSVDYGGVNSLDIALPPGNYFIRGELAQTFAREKLVDIPAGEIVDLAFDFAAGRVFVAMTDMQSVQVPRQIASFFDGMRRDWFMYGGGGPQNGNWTPFYLPQGTWRIEARNDQRQENAVAVATVPGPGQDVTVTLRDGDTLSEARIAELSDAATGNCHAVGPQGRICYVETVSPARIARELPSAAFGGDALAPRFTGTWDVETSMMTLVQDGRRVWGEVRPLANQSVRRLYGEVAADGLTMRGTITGTGIFEFRLSPDGLGFSGGGAHFGGGDTGTRVSLSLNNTRYAARKLSAAPPPLSVADGSEADLHPAFQGAAVAAFEDFMAPVRTPAPAGTAGDLDAMQSMSPFVTFGGAWNTERGFIQFQQDGRRIWGERDQGVLEGELSPDGLLMRGTWTNTNGRWGLFEFVLDPLMHSFSGRWGYAVDPALAGGAWTGDRASWLAAQPQRATRDGTRNPDASGPDFAAFMTAVRAPDLVPAAEPAEPTQPQAMAPDGAFVPQVRYDYTHADGRAAISFVFGPPESMPGQFDSYTRGFALMHPGWCGGTECSEPEVYPIGGPTLEEVPNAFDRLTKGGVFPALDLFAQGIAVFEGDANTGPDLQVFVHILSEPFEEAVQLGAGRALVSRSYGPFQGAVTMPPTLRGFGDLTGSGPALPLSEPAPPIGRIDVLPSGVFAMLDVAPGQMLQDAMQSLLVAPLDMMVQAQCATQPTVIHDDGLIAERDLRIGQRADINALFETTAYRICEQSGPLLFCDDFQAPLGTSPHAPAHSFLGTIEVGPQGTFALGSDNPAVPARVYRSCLAPVDLAGADQPAGDGRTRLQHMLDREDQPARSGALAPAQDPLGGDGLIDFARLQGIWGETQGGIPGLSCQTSPIVIRADGRIGVWDGDGNGGLALIARFSCTPTGGCDVLATNLPPERMPQAVTLADAGTMLDLCGDGNCTRLASCPLAALPDNLEPYLLAELDAADQGATPVAETAATRLPPGIWLADFETEGQGITPGSAAFVEACFDTPSVSYPDGSIISLELREEANGPVYSVIAAETCAASGDARWPLTCTLEDANVGDPAAAVFEVPTQLYSRSADTFRQVGDYGGGYVQSFFWRACQQGAGMRIDLDTHPLGPLLASTLRELNQGIAPTVIPSPDPVQGGQLAPPPDMRLALAGLWFPRLDGRELSAWSDAEKRHACRTTPGYMHEDGLFVAFETKAGDYSPTPNAHLRCGTDLTCDFYPGAPSAGLAATLVGNIALLPDGDGRICLDGICVGLSRCAIPDWTAQDRAIGLDREWEATVLGRN
ncbi:MULTISPECIES: vWA domain-containing protein [unclassified Yoonia]|uniref:vWA domain-containing protein n=1 Tax=unclassified Yoonia TaxID=2629118 RepID=UPI002AFF9C24|nr:MULTISPECIES: VWA domain-containing protein [unclassified Yoonia]